MIRMGYCPSGRLFEATACGTPILSDWWKGLDDFFEPQRELLVGRTTENTLDALALSDAELRRISRRARARAIEEHSAERRAHEWEELLSGTTQPVSNAARSASFSYVEG